jgi:hypothetical protein
MAQQDGYIFRKGDSWFLRYRDAGKQRCKKLANVCERYRREKDAQTLAAEFLAPLNAGKVRPESYISVSDFATNHWLPWANANCKPSTVAGYQAFWKLYLRPHMPELSLRDFRTVDACNLFTEIYRKHKVSKRVLRNAKSILRSIFALAKTWGAFDGANPLVDARLPMEAPASIPTHAATPDEVLKMIEVLKKAGEMKARAAVALIFSLAFGPAKHAERSGRITMARSCWSVNQFGIAIPRHPKRQKPPRLCRSSQCWLTFSLLCAKRTATRRTARSCAARKAGPCCSTTFHSGTLCLD